MVTVWYVVVRPDNQYPVLIYPEKERAELVARKNGYRVISVVPISPAQATCLQPEPAGATP